MRPSRQPSQQPSAQPSKQPTQQPSAQPVMQPSAQPLSFPTQQPTSQPSRQPSRRPSMQPTRIPSRQPSAQPTNQPSRQPNNQPTNQPTHQPSQRPTNRPSKQPTMVLTTAYLCISSHILIIIHCNVTSCPFITTTSNQVHSLSCGLPANLPNNLFNFSIDPSFGNLNSPTKSKMFHVEHFELEPSSGVGFGVEKVFQKLLNLLCNYKWAQWKTL